MRIELYYASNVTPHEVGTTCGIYTVGAKKVTFSFPLQGMKSAEMKMKRK
jgi:hypothetical protein